MMMCGDRRLDRSVGKSEISEATNADPKVIVDMDGDRNSICSCKAGP
jgi:hypothetical protein